MSARIVNESNRATKPAPISYQCPLCGHSFEFDKERNTGGCAKCPLSKGCGLVLCPNCRYEFPEESRLLNWIGRLLKRDEKKPDLLWQDAPGTISLNDLGIGKSGEVVSLGRGEDAKALRLSAMGISPGSHITVRQKLPTVVIAVGETEIALDRAVTKTIHVKPVLTDER